MLVEADEAKVVGVDVVEDVDVFDTVRYMPTELRSW